MNKAEETTASNDNNSAQEEQKNIFTEKQTTLIVYEVLRTQSILCFKTDKENEVLSTDSYKMNSDGFRAKTQNAKIKFITKYKNYLQKIKCTLNQNGQKSQISIAEVRTDVKQLLIHTSYRKSANKIRGWKDFNTADYEQSRLKFQSILARYSKVLERCLAGLETIYEKEKEILTTVNMDRQKARQQETITCECGCNVSKRNIKKHQKSTRHTKAMELLSQFPTNHS
jgi:hypothetical protein